MGSRGRGRGRSPGAARICPQESGRWCSPSLGGAPGPGRDSPQPQWLASRPLAGEGGRGSGRTPRTRRGSEGSSGGGRENPGPAGAHVRWAGDGRLGGQQGGAVALGDKNPSLHAWGTGDRNWTGVGAGESGE